MKRHLKKTLSLLLALAMVFSLAVSAGAEGTEPTTGNEAGVAGESPAPENRESAGNGNGEEAPVPTPQGGTSPETLNGEQNQGDEPGQSDEPNQSDEPAPDAQGDSALARIQSRIDALPDATDVQTLIERYESEGGDELNAQITAIYDETAALLEAVETLGEERAALDTEKLDALVAVFTPEAEQLADVAEVDGTKYASLEEAIEKAPNGSTITLLSDVKYTVTTVVDMSENTLDLGSHTITVAAAVGNELNAIVFTGTNFKIQNGIFDTEGNYALWIGDSPETNGVTVENVTVGGINVFNAQNVVLRDVTSAGQNYYSVWADINADVTIESGTYTTKGTNGLLGTSMQAGAPYGTLVVEGGDFTINDEKFAPTGNDNIIVSGGTFSDEAVSQYILDGYDADGTGGQFTVGKANTQTDDHVAEVDGQYFKTVQGAIDAAPEGGTVKLLKDADAGNTQITKSLTLDLGGNTLNLVKTEGKSVGIDVRGDVRITNGTVYDKRTEDTATGSWFTVCIRSGQTFTTDKVTFISNCPAKTTNAYNYVLYAQTGSELNLNEGTVIKEGAASAADTWGCVGTGIMDSCKLTVDGASITTTGFAVAGNGEKHHTEITIKENSNLTSKDLAIYHPQDGTLNVEGGTITGNTGIEMRAGTLNVTGGTIAGTGVPATVMPNGSGGTSGGAGIAVSQHTTKLPINVNISGGKISGFSALYENNPEKNDKADIDKVKINVTGGEFEAINGGMQALYSEDVRNFVSGGKFNTAVPHSDANDYCAPDYVPQKNSDGSYGVHPHGEDGEWMTDGSEHWHVCGICNEKFDAAAHSKGTELQSDAANHWYACTVCGEKLDEAAHVSDGGKVTTPAGEFKDGVKTYSCTACGKVLKTESIPATHVHSYGAEWKSDGAKHWHVCACGAKTAEAAHDFKWIIDKEPTYEKTGLKHERCAVCGYEKPAVTIPAGKTPQTGDESSIRLYVLMTLAACGLTTTALYGRKRKQN